MDTNHFARHRHPCHDFTFSVLTMYPAAETPAEAYRLARALDSGLTEIADNTALTYIELIAECNAFKFWTISQMTSGESTPLECAIAGFAIGQLDALIASHPAA